MNEAEVFLQAIKKANGNNEILESLRVDGVAFIDYKTLTDKTIDGLKVNSCIRLKTLPKKSGFVGSRKIYYNKIDIGGLYPFVNDALVVVSEHADIDELLDELNTQCGILIEKTFIKNNLKEKLVFDNDKCGNVVLTTNEQSLFLSGSITVQYTCNKYRILNYVENRTVLLSENEFVSESGVSDISCVPWYCYYYDLANFPPDHDLYTQYELLADPGPATPNNQYGAYRTTIEEYIASFKNLGSAKSAWDEKHRYVLKRTILAYLKYVSLNPWYLLDDDKPENKLYDNTVYVPSAANKGILSANKNPPMTMDDYVPYFYGKTTDLLSQIKQDYDYVSGTAGLNLNYNNVFALKYTNPNKKTIGVNTLLTFYWH